MNQPEASQRVLRSSGDPVLYVDVVDAHAQLVDIDLTSSYLAQAEIGSTPPTHNYMLVVTSHSVDLCYCISDVILFTYAVDRSAIAQARIVYFAGGIAGIVLILAEGSIRVLSLLKLELLFEIDALVESDSVDSAVITSDGRIFYHDHGGFLKTASLLEHFSP